MGKIKVLWIDQDIKDDSIGLRRTLYQGIYPNTKIQLVNSLRELQRMADNAELSSFEVAVAHMSFNGLNNFMSRHREDMCWSRFGIVTDETLERVAKDVMRQFSPDFLADYSDEKFIRQQINKKWVTPEEAERRGRELLTSIGNFSAEGQSIRRERSY